MSAGIENYTGGLIAYQEGSDEAEYAYVAIPTASEAVLKSRFYLDVLLAVDDVQSEGTVYGFIGGCEVGSENYKMHADARQFYLGGVEGSEDYVFFNDGGLNTLAQSGMPNSSLEGTGVVVSIDKPSYHNEVTQANLVYRRTSQQTWHTVQYQGDLSASSYYFPVGDVPGGYPIPPNVELEAYMILVNSEGSMVGDKNTFTVQADLIQTLISFTGYEFVGSNLVIFINSDKTAVNDITGTITDQGSNTQNFTIDMGQNNTSVTFPNYSVAGSNSFFLQNVNGGAGHAITVGGNITVFPP